MVNKKLYIAGHTGMVGSAILRRLQKEGFDNLILRTSKELDLRNQRAVNNFFEAEKPEIVIIAAAKAFLKNRLHLSISKFNLINLLVVQFFQKDFFFKCNI